jgi:hypothetical protein
MRLLLIIGIFLLCLTLNSQENYKGWNEVHHWDGRTPWTQYLKYSSKYMGPNALPVPVNIAGQTGDSSFIEFNTTYHYYSGDKTNDFGYNCYINLVKNLVSVQIYGVIIEHYLTDSATRDERASRNIRLEGYAFGDVNFSTIIQLVHESTLPDIALRINLKTASGQKMEEARYSDGPGYYFDISAGKSFKYKSAFIQKLRLKAYAGFYCWQTMLTQQRQSDAYMYSFGVDLFLRKNIWIFNELSGYNGSLNKGDKPVILKSSVHYTYKRSGLYIEYFSGLNDYLYNSFRFGIQYHLGK